MSPHQREFTAAAFTLKSRMIASAAVGAVGAVGAVEWDQSPGELTWGQQWAERLDELSEDESSRLWAAVYAARHEDLAHRLHQRHGLSSPLWYVNAWYAGVQVRDGDPVAARRTLTEALHHWLPFEAWNALPVDLAVQDTLRPAATPSFRAQILAALPAHLPWEKHIEARG
ncbi:hypothetical protein [Kineococcus arenarius]|uniref:hypothetical protein n=1 Tax=Kineococcus sp. SYSU DK007 TaxID=3383128 RepID=UPI003D7EE1F0